MTTTTLTSPTVDLDRRRATVRLGGDGPGTTGIRFTARHDRDDKVYVATVEVVEIHEGYETATIRLYQANPHRRLVDAAQATRFNARRFAAFVDGAFAAAAAPGGPVDGLAADFDVPNTEVLR